MLDDVSRPCAAFQGTNRIAHGRLIDVALTVKAAMEKNENAIFLTFDDATGAVIDLDLRGSAAEVKARLAPRTPAPEAPEEDQVRARGRPKLGVTAREVTLLPRHWDWLASQPGGASSVLRRLVEEARRGDGGRTQARAARAAAYKFLSAMAGDFPGFEEASRALFAGDDDRFAAHTASWPPDVRSHAQMLMAAGEKAEAGLA